MTRKVPTGRQSIDERIARVGVPSDLPLDERIAQHGPPPIQPSREQKDYTYLKCTTCNKKRIGESGRTECLECDQKSSATYYPTVPDGRTYLYGLDRMRHERGMTLHELATEAGVHPTTLGGHIRLKTRAKVQTQYLYCTALGCELEDIRNGF